MMPAETSNRVKSILSRFESLEEEKKPPLTRPTRKTSIPQLKKVCDEPPLPRDAVPRRLVLADVNECYNFKSLPTKPVVKSYSVVNGEKPRVLSRQTSDPSRKLQRSPAFRCDRNVKAWEGGRRSLRYTGDDAPTLRLNRKPSLHDSEIPKHILDQYAKVVKVRNQDAAAMSDSGISSENEATSLTDTLKKALKQPLPNGPPPKKPPRLFAQIEPPPKTALKKLEKIEIALNSGKTILPRVVTPVTPISSPKEDVHYLCTEILNLHNASDSSAASEGGFSSLTKCFNSLNCSNTSNRASIGYVRFAGDHSPTKSAVGEIVSESSTAFCATDIFSNIKLKRSRSQEHIYAVPFEGSKPPPLLRTRTQLEDGFATSRSEPRGAKVRDILKKIESKSIRETATNPADTPTTATKILNHIYDAPSLEEEAAVVLCAPTATSKTKTYERKSKILERRNRIYGRPDLARRSNELGKSQLDIDRENLNRLMNDIYETVAAACKMDAAALDSVNICPIHSNSPCQCSADLDDAGLRRLAKFPVNSDNADTSSEDSVKLTRSLTEKRKNYVRRVSSRAAYLEATNPGSVRVRYRQQTSIGASVKQEPAQCSNPYATFRSWKSFKMLHPERTGSPTRTQTALEDSSDALDTSVADSSTEFEAGLEMRGDTLFDACILVGMNHYTGRAYIKSTYPSGVQVPPQLEMLVFPEIAGERGLSSSRRRPASARGGSPTVDASSVHQYSLVLTNERGERHFAYCRRVLPEGASFCLPLAYCLISRYRSAGFFYKILEMLESHHGSPDVCMEWVLRQLHECKFPQPGEVIHLRQPKSPNKAGSLLLRKNSPFRNSVNLGDVFQARTLRIYTDDRSDLVEDSRESLLSESDGRRRSGDGKSIFYDQENNNSDDAAESEDGRRVECFEDVSLKMCPEPRLEEENLSILLQSLSVGNILKIFGTLLIERKVLIVGDNLSQLSSCMEALQTILYPFVWQHTLISTVPSEIRRDILEAPIPLLAGVLLSAKSGSVDKSRTAPSTAKTELLQDDQLFEEQLKSANFDEGMVIDLRLKSASKPLFVQGDESTLLPSYCAKTLKASLSLDGAKEKSGKGENGGTRNFLIAEAFLRFFVDLFGDFANHFTAHQHWNADGSPTSDLHFDKEQFVKSASSKQSQYFLEWFTETAMFSHFIGNMTTVNRNSRAQSSDPLVDVPYPHFYRVFEERVAQRRALLDAKKNGQNKAADASKSPNYKLLVNRKELKNYGGCIVSSTFEVFRHSALNIAESAEALSW